MKKGKEKSPISIYDTLKKMRGDWGNINPVTKVIPNRKHDYEYPDTYYDYEMEEEEYE